jgi:hypothetical protein
VLRWASGGGATAIDPHGYDEGPTVAQLFQVYEGLKARTINLGLQSCLKPDVETVLCAGRARAAPYINPTAPRGDPITGFIFWGVPRDRDSGRSPLGHDQPSDASPWQVRSPAYSGRNTRPRVRFVPASGRAEASLWRAEL